MKTVLLIVGVVAVLVGLLWIGQGAGLVDWPASSFMIDQRPWITRGAILAVVGLVLIALFAEAIAAEVRDHGDCPTPARLCLSSGDDPPAFSKLQSPA